MESQGLKNPSQPQQSSPQLFIGDLDQSVTENVLFQHLNRFGPINHIRLIRKNPANNNHALVSFQQPDAAIKVQNELDGELINGKHIRVVKFTQERSQEANVFVKNTPESVTPKEFKDYFSVCGNIISSKLVYDEKGIPLRYGFIQFEKSQSAQAAISKSGSVWHGQTITVSKFLPVSMRIDNSSNMNLYVRGFPATMSESDIQAKFAQFGNLLSVALMRSKNGLPFGFICYDSQDAANAALALNGADEDGFSWYVVPHMKKTYRLALLREKYVKQVSLWKKNNLYIRNLPSSIDEEKLKKICEEFGGEITSVKICKSENIKFEIKYDADGSQVISQGPSQQYTYDADGIRVPSQSGITKEMTSRGVAFVCFREESGLFRAIKGLKTKTIDGRQLFLARWMPREELRKSIMQSKMKKKMKFTFPPNPYNPPYNPMHIGRGNSNQRPYRQPYPHPQGKLRSIPSHMQQAYPPINHQREQNQTPIYSQPVQNIQQGNMGRPNQEIIKPADPPTEKQILGESLYLQVVRCSNSQIAGKITGMLLELTNGEILELLKNPQEIKNKVYEAIDVLRRAWKDKPEFLANLPN